MKKGMHVAGAAALLLALLVTACGGGGGGGNGTGGIDRGGITIAVGPVTGFGSIFVNGVEYLTSGATVSVDDNPGTESDLRVGQIVRVEGTVDSSGTKGAATRVTFNDQVEGPIQSIDLSTNRMVILGQTVQVGPDTSFDDGISPASLEGLSVGQRVEISGTVASTGNVNASRIELKAPSAASEVKGAVASVDTGNKRFFINQLRVDYSSAQVNGFGSGQPANGDYVEAKGTVSGAALTATSVEKKSAGSPGGSNDKGNYEGLVTRFVSSADFDVAGQRVATTGSTTYSGGTSSNLALDVKVRVEGSFDSGGRLVATKVEFRQEANIEIDARVDSVNAAGNSLVVLGVTVRTNSLTRLEDKSSAQVQRFSLANLNAGDYVSIHAYDSGGLVATQLERVNALSRIELKGPAGGLNNNPNFTVAGIPVTTNASTEFRDASGATVSAATFFAAAAGQSVKVRGTLSGNTVLAERAEIED